MDAGMGMMGGALGFWLRSSGRLLASGAGGLTILSLAAYGAFLRGWWIPLVPPAMAWLASAALITAYMLNQEKKSGRY